MQVPLDQLTIETDPTIKTIWVDRMDIVVRHDVPVGTLCFYSTVTDKDYKSRMNEACRIQVSVGQLKNMVDVISRVIGHYPTSHAEGQKKKK